MRLILGPAAVVASPAAGKRLLPIDEFLRGYRVRPQDRFGPESPSIQRG